MQNDNLIKSTGVFIYDLVVVLCFPDRESENTIVNCFLRGFPHPDFILEAIKSHKKKLPKFSGQGLKNMFKERFNRSLAIDDKLQTFVSSVRLLENTGKSIAGGAKTQR